MTGLFQPAERMKTPVRLGIAGVSSSGKTLGALLVAYGITKDWSKIFVIDTEKKAHMYVGSQKWGIGQFQYAILDAPFTPSRYVDLIQAAVAEGAEVVIVDSGTHEWAGTGGLLQRHSELRQGGGKGEMNEYVNWAKVNPDHDKFMSAIIDCKAHIIVTFRAKEKSVIEVNEQTGKNVVRSLGEQPIFRPESHYEFMFYVMLDRETHLARCITTGGDALDPEQPYMLNAKFGEDMKSWSETGSAIPIGPALPSQPVVRYQTSSQNAAQSATAGQPSAQLQKAIDDHKAAVAEAGKFMGGVRAALSFPAKQTVTDLVEAAKKIRAWIVIYTQHKDSAIKSLIDPKDASAFERRIMVMIQGFEKADLLRVFKVQALSDLSFDLTPDELRTALYQDATAGQANP